MNEVGGVNLDSLLQGLVEPAVVVEKNRFVIVNPAAQKLFGEELSYVLPEELIDPIFLENSSNVTGTMVIDDRRYQATSIGDEDRRILIIHDTRTNTQPDVEEMAMASVRSLLATCKMSMEKIAGIMKGSQQYDEVSHTVAVVNRSLYGISRIADNLSTVWEDSSENLYVNNRVFDLAELCGEVIGSARYYMPEQSKKISWDCESVKMPFYGDPEMIRRLILNLLSNSVKNTNKWGKISIFINSTIDGYLIRFMDNGPGIPEVKLNQILQGRGMLDSGGVGLGMLVVSIAAKVHNGSMAVESTPRGTNVSVHLPVSSIPSNVDQEPREHYAGEPMLYLKELVGLMDLSYYAI